MHVSIYTHTKRKIEKDHLYTEIIGLIDRVSLTLGDRIENLHRKKGGKNIEQHDHATPLRMLIVDWIRENCNEN